MNAEEYARATKPIEANDLFEEMRQQVSKDPVREFTNNVGAAVLDAADRIERELGTTLTDKERGYLITVLTEAAIQHVARRLKEGR